MEKFNFTTISQEKILTYASYELMRLIDTEEKRIEDNFDKSMPVAKYRLQRYKEQLNEIRLSIISLQQ